MRRKFPSFSLSLLRSLLLREERSLSPSLSRDGEFPSRGELLPRSLSHDGISVARRGERKRSFSSPSPLLFPFLFLLLVLFLSPANFSLSQSLSSSISPHPLALSLATEIPSRGEAGGNSSPLSLCTLSFFFSLFLLSLFLSFRKFVFLLFPIFSLFRVRPQLTSSLPLFFSLFLSHPLSLYFFSFSLYLSLPFSFVRASMIPLTTEFSVARRSSPPSIFFSLSSLTHPRSLFFSLVTETFPSRGELFLLFLFPLILSLSFFLSFFENYSSLFPLSFLSLQRSPLSPPFLPLSLSLSPTFSFFSSASLLAFPGDGNYFRHERTARRTLISLRPLPLLAPLFRAREGDIMATENNSVASLLLATKGGTSPSLSSFLLSPALSLFISSSPRSLSPSLLAASYFSRNGNFPHVSFLRRPSLVLFLSSSASLLTSRSSFIASSATVLCLSRGG